MVIGPLIASTKPLRKRVMIRYVNSSPKARSAALPKRDSSTTMRTTRNRRKPRKAGLDTGIMPRISYQLRST